ncbi:hypothetical protein GGI24_005763 [Coemansia furcata]|nr:hypothetical protein GGI24_005763 [Coemansia furcata]
MRFSENYDDRAHKNDITSAYHSQAPNQQGDVVQPQEQQQQQQVYEQQPYYGQQQQQFQQQQQVHEQQPYYEQRQFQQPGFIHPQVYPSQQPPSPYQAQSPYNPPPPQQVFEQPTKVDNTWDYSGNQQYRGFTQSGRPDELEQGYNSGYDSTDGYGMDRGLSEVKQKVVGAFVQPDEDGDIQYNKRNIAIAAVAAATVAVGTAYAIKEYRDHKKTKDNEQRDQQIGGGSHYNNTNDNYPSTDVPPYTESYEAYQNSSGYYGNP